MPDYKYKESEDPCKFKSVKTNRGPLTPNWRVGRSLSHRSRRCSQGSIGVLGVHEANYVRLQDRSSALRSLGLSNARGRFHATRKLVDHSSYPSTLSSIRPYVIFCCLHIDKHSHGWMNGETRALGRPRHDRRLSVCLFLSPARYDMTIEQVREYEREMFERTNKKVMQATPAASTDNTVFD